MNEPSAKRFWARLNNSVLLRFLLFFSAGWAFIQILDYFEILLVVFIFAAVLAFLLNYPTEWLSRFLPRRLAVGLVFLGSLVLIGGLLLTIAFAVFSQGELLLQSIIDLLNTLGQMVEQLENYLQARNIQIDLGEVEAQARNFILNVLGASFATAQAFLRNTIILILILVIAFFMMLSGQQLWLLALRGFPPPLQHRIGQTVQQNFLGFFRGQLILVLFLTAASLLVFRLFDAPFALLLALIVGFFDAIPGIGATLGLGIVSLILLSQSWGLALQVLLASIGLQQIQDNLIAPLVMRDAVNVNPVVIFLALLVGARVAGLLGIFLAVPVAGMVVNLLEIDEMRSNHQD